MRHRFSAARPSTVIGGALVAALVFRILPLSFETVGVVAAVAAAGPVLDILWDLSLPLRRAAWRAVFRTPPAGEADTGGTLVPGGLDDGHRDEPRSEPGRTVHAGDVVRGAIGLIVAVVLFSVTRGPGSGIGFGFTNPFDREVPRALGPDQAATAAADPTVAAALAECLPPSLAAERAAPLGSTPVAMNPLICVVGYVSLSRDGLLGGEVFLDDLEADPKAPGIVLLVGFSEVPPEKAVVRAWGWIEPADAPVCQPVDEPCLMVVPMQIGVLRPPPG